MPVIQNGVDAIITAARPLGTNISAQITPPLPTPSSRAPLSRNPGSAFHEGIGLPCRRRNAARIEPAMT